VLGLPRVELPETTSSGLKAYQSQVDGMPDFSTQVTRAKFLFSQANKSNNAVFRVVRERLTAICNGHGRCCYCELSQPDEVEHICPKDLYPEVAFVWENYVYACGICNGTWKNNKFGIIDNNGNLCDVTRARQSPVAPPVKGHPAFINPRVEDTLALLELDIVDTFLFLPRASSGSSEYLRADYTIQLLGLNQRSILPRARANAFGAYRARLTEYRNRRDAGAPEVTLSEMRLDLLASPHPFVWREMQRQPEVRGDIAQLFEEVPEAKQW
jgi:uncharacterized protein (TIGR02646 family)